MTRSDCHICCCYKLKRVSARWYYEASLCLLVCLEYEGGTLGCLQAKSSLVVLQVTFIPFSQQRKPLRGTNKSEFFPPETRKHIFLIWVNLQGTSPEDFYTITLTASLLSREGKEKVKIGWSWCGQIGVGRTVYLLCSLSTGCQSSLLSGGLPCCATKSSLYLVSNDRNLCFSSVEAELHCFSIW